MERFIYGRKIFLIVGASLLIFSCSTYYWTDFKEASLDPGEKLYGVKTISDETISFRYIPRGYGLFTGTNITGINSEGQEVFIELEEVREIELADWGPEIPYVVCGVTAAVLAIITFEMITVLPKP